MGGCSPAARDGERCRRHHGPRGLGGLPHTIERGISNPPNQREVLGGGSSQPWGLPHTIEGCPSLGAAAHKRRGDLGLCSGHGLVACRLHCRIPGSPGLRIRIDRHNCSWPQVLPVDLGRAADCWVQPLLGFRFCVGLPSPDEFGPGFRFLGPPTVEFQALPADPRPPKDLDRTSDLLRPASELPKVTNLKGPGLGF